MSTRLEPKLVRVLREGYSRETFLGDLAAGAIVGVIALPLSIALAIASGVRPEQGLYTAIVGGFLISALGGSRVQIGGPTGAFVVLVLEIVRSHGYDGLAAATIMAGILLVLFGVMGLGRVIRFIPYPVTVGFTAGIALLIFSTQIPDLLGLTRSDWPDGFFERWIAYAGEATALNPWALAVGLGAFAITRFGAKISRAIPGSLLAIIVTSVVVHWAGLPVETIESRLGAVPSSPPTFAWPQVGWNELRDLFSPAVSIALLAGIESLLSAVVADGMTGRRHNSDTELAGLGIANIASALFGGIPVTGAIARTAANVKNGGRTPVAGITHAVTLLLILLFAGRYAGLIPMATLAGILIVVADNMSERHLFFKIVGRTGGSGAVSAITFLLTVFVDLTTAIQVGVVLASLLFMARMSAAAQVGDITETLNGDGEETSDPMALATRRVPPGVQVFEINGPFFFGATDRFKDALDEIAKPPKVLILRMRHVPVIDATAMRALEDVVRRAEREGSMVVLSGVQPGPREAMERYGLVALAGPENVVGDIDEALERARAALDRGP